TTPAPPARARARPTCARTRRPAARPPTRPARAPASRPPATTPCPAPPPAADPRGSRPVDANSSTKSSRTAAVHRRVRRGTVSAGRGSHLLTRTGRRKAAEVLLFVDEFEVGELEAGGRAVGVERRG